MGGNNLSHPKAHNPMISYKKLYAESCQFDEALACICCGHKSREI